VATIAEVFALALQSHQAGNLHQAEQLYRQILQVQPEHADAHHLLGVLAYQMGRYHQAIASIRHALTMNPNAAVYYTNLGAAHAALGQIDEAIGSYHEALRRQPDNAGTCNNLAVALERHGKLDEAVRYCRQALRLQPDYPEAHYNLGNNLKRLDKLDDAIHCYRQALQLRPQYVEACVNLGVALREQGHLEAAVDCYRQALRLNPNFAEAHYNLGNALQGLAPLDEAVACYRQAVRLKPDFAVAHLNLGQALWELGRLDEAVACCRRALELDPGCAEAHVNLARLLREQGQALEAIACCRRALQLNPDNPGTLALLVNRLQQLSLWDDLGDLAQRVIEAIAKGAVRGSGAAVQPFLFFALPTTTTAEQHLQCSRQWLEQGLKLVRGPKPEASRKSEVESRKTEIQSTFSDTGHRTSDLRPPTSDLRHSVITVGYLSADFQEHATAYLIAELIEKHDRERFRIIGYSYGPDDGGPMRRRLAKAFDRFVDVKDISFLAAARCIQADEVDILVDLKGYTRHARTPILGYRPAPLQVNYLGYPGTMAAPFIDYILVDDFIVPPDQQPFFTEKLVHLPGCYQVNDSQREIAASTPSRAECGLPETGFVFCCFNGSYKITRQVFGVWLELLKAVPGSVLWLLEDNPFSSANLGGEAQARGVGAERLVFAPLLGLPEHLARHRLADLFLDTVPVNAHTTASDALWAGCPVLTLAGQTFPSRVAGSLLRTLGLPELITTSLQEYQERALRLARDADFLKDLRARLQAGRANSALFDGGRFARNLEQAFVTMWAIHTAGEQPRPFAVGSPLEKGTAPNNPGEENK